MNTLNPLSKKYRAVHSVAVHPIATTTYTLEAEGPYGSATRTVQVVVTP